MTINSVCVYQDPKQSGHTAYRWSKKNLLKRSCPRLVKNSNIMHENCFFLVSSTKFSEIWKKSLKLVITKGYGVLVTMIACQNAIAPAKSSTVLCISFMWLKKGFNFVWCRLPFILLMIENWWPQTSPLINNSNRTEWSPIPSVIIQVINKVNTRSPICLITSMITDRIGRHKVLLPNILFTTVTKFVMF